MSVQPRADVNDAYEQSTYFPHMAYQTDKIEYVTNAGCCFAVSMGASKKTPNADIRALKFNEITSNSAPI